MLTSEHALVSFSSIPGTVFEQSLGTCVWPADAYAPCGTKDT